MADTPLPDYYEILQVSPRADQETIDRVFRHLAKRYHPDNKESGNADRFAELVTAHDVLSDTAQRATYDVRYESVRESRWKIFNQDSATSEISNDARVRLAILSLMYVARRNDLSEPGIGIIELEKVLAVPQNVLQFQMWYLRENAWVERLTTGHFAITASGVDKLFELGGPYKTGPHLLRPGEAVEESA
ncbi:MAG TPA: DnaJ domain-containing protein [Gemmatimonadaceae bacterium]